MSRILSLDIGEKRTGFAISDESRVIAQPLDFTVPAGKIVETIKDLHSEYEIGLILLGLPTSMSGQEGQQAAIIKKIGKKLSESIDIPIEYFDERLTSKQARYLQQDAPDTPLDCLAAQLLLEQYLWSHNRQQAT